MERRLASEKRSDYLWNKKYINTKIFIKGRSMHVRRHYNVRL